VQGRRLKGNRSDQGEPVKDSFLSVDSSVYGKGNISFDAEEKEEDVTSFGNLLN